MEFKKTKREKGIKIHNESLRRGTKWHLGASRYRYMLRMGQSSTLVIGAQDGFQTTLPLLQRRCRSRCPSSPQSSMLARAHLCARFFNSCRRAAKAGGTTPRPHTLPPPPMMMPATSLSPPPLMQTPTTLLQLPPMMTTVTLLLPPPLPPPMMTTPRLQCCCCC